MSPHFLSDNITFNPTCILIHGCHLQAEEWENLVFGHEDLLGRVPTGIEEAVNRNAGLIFWGSGGSQLADGTKESEHTFRQSLGPKLEELAQRVSKEPNELAHYLNQVSVIDGKTRNTTEEIKAAIAVCQTKGIEEVYLISSVSHIARCLQEACKFQEKNTHISIKFYARASDTCFAHSTAGDVTIIEPPHRGDTPKVPFYKTLKGIFPLYRNERIAFSFNEALIKLIEDYIKML